MKHIITFNNDIKKYPPIISIINELIKKKHIVYILGYCSSNEIIKKWRELGVIYHQVFIDDVNANAMIKFNRLIKYRNNVKKSIIDIYEDGNTNIWVFGVRNLWLLGGMINKYKFIMYLFEVPEFKVPFRFKLINPFFDYTASMKSASKIVCCEYNRSMITKSFFNLDITPQVIPNKPNFNNKDVPKLSKDIYEKIKDKKVILYQGVFNFPERKLDTLCEAIKLLPIEYIILLVGDSCEYKDLLESKYKSDKVIFIDFIPFPAYLSITSNAYIGYITYCSPENNIYQSLNTLYCAPNKIYEYAQCNLPIISNDLPAIRDVLNKYRFGEICDDSSPEEIANKILKIDKNYTKYSNQCSGFVDSFHLSDTLDKLLEIV